MVRIAGSARARFFNYGFITFALAIDSLLCAPHLIRFCG